MNWAIPFACLLFPAALAPALAEANTDATEKYSTDAQDNMRRVARRGREGCPSALLIECAPSGVGNNSAAPTEALSNNVTRSLHATSTRQRSKRGCNDGTHDSL